MQNLLLNFFITTLFLIGNAQAQSCSWTDQIKYPDGSVGCLSELPFAKEIVKEEKKSINDYLSGSSRSAVAISKYKECKGIGVAAINIRSPNLNLYSDPSSSLQKVALDRCMNQGCDCEIIIVDSVSKVNKRSLLSMLGNNDDQKVAITNPPTKEVISPDKKIKEELAAIKITEDKKTLVTNPPTKEVVIPEKKVKEELVAAKLTDEQIAALRREMEKEIRSSILAEAAIKNKSELSIASTKVYANRKALVIGNDSYQKVSLLSNAREDARLMAENLTASGFKVQLKLDVTEKQFKSELRIFKNSIQPGDEVAIFYAGHGVQLSSTNYLLPIDIAGQNEEEVKDEAIPLQRILDDMNEKGAKFTIAMIDACRDNPFKSSARSIGGTRGLAPTTAATGQMIIFSAGSGQQALDKLGPTDKSKNGLFTRVFAQEMHKTGVTVDRVVRNVRLKVVEMAKSVGHNQVPAIYDQVVGEFYFRQ